MEISNVLKVENRESMSGNANKRLRKSGYLPATISSKEIGSVSVTIKRDTFQRALNKNGKSAVFKLELDGGMSYNAMVKDIQFAPLSGDYLNISFQHVSLSEETKVDVDIKVEGKENLESRRLLLIQHMDILTVKGLPQDIPNSIEIDASNMQAGENLFVSDIKLAEGITTEANPELLVLSIIEPKANKSQAEDEDSEAEE